MFIEFLKLMFLLIVIYALIFFYLISKNSFIKNIIRQKNDNKSDCSNNGKKFNILLLINFHPKYGNREQKHIDIHNLI